MKVLNHLICKICDMEFESARARNKHIFSYHKITLYDYITKYILKEIPVCQCGCNTPIKKIQFIKNEIVYAKYTSNHFPRKEHSLETRSKIKENTKKAINKKYGVDNVFMTKWCQDKINKTRLKKYGFKTYNNIEKNYKTKLDKYGNKAYNNPEKIKTTTQSKYGVNSYTSSEKGKQQVRETNLERYGVTNPMKLEIIKKKMGDTKQEKYGYYTEFISPEYRKKYNNKTSKIEEQVCKQINGQHKFFFKNKEFDIKLKNDIYEIDGDFWHPSTIQKLTISQISSLINDKQKIEIIKNSPYNLYKIHVSDIKNQDIITDSILKDIAYLPNYSITYDQKIITKEYFANYINKKGSTKLEKYSYLLLKFLREFNSDFVIPESTEDLNVVLQKIKDYNLDIVYKTSDIIRGNISNIGSDYLKSKFLSFWKSSNRNALSPYDIWYNDEALLKIIKNRIGINSFNTSFDFSLKSLIRGMYSNKFVVSFFKPLLAAAIYKKFLFNKKNPTVIDPCAGFGGRLLGFKALYPNGIYIGIEPNRETYNELLNLKSELVRIGISESTIKLYNCKQEDYTGTLKADLTFTSIPYYDLETYSESQEYDSFENWNNTFVDSLKRFENIHINISKSINDKITSKSILFKIENNTGHFNKNSSTKQELIVKL